MKKTFTIVIFFIIFLVIYLFQTNFFSWYNIAGIKPNLFIIFTVFIGMFIGKNYGLYLGIIFGLLLDLFIGKRIGINGITLAISGLLGEIFDKSFSRDNRITLVFITFGVTIICELINYLLQIIFFRVGDTIIVIMSVILIEAIYNGILVIILYPLIQKIGNKIEEIFTEKKSLMKYY